ncbi:MAG: hypothetical protein KAX57_14515 [Rhodoferax sp.]|jgi:hypothetical protein|nr:hypothetical protein [Rhodoferax sp.]
MIELLLEVVGEFLIQVVVETLIQLGFHSLAAPFKRTPNPWMAAAGYTMFGAIFGGISLYAFPTNLAPPSWRVINLVITPVAVGVIVALLGKRRVKRGQPTLRIDRFSYGYLFALSLGLVRFQFAA